MADEQNIKETNTPVEPQENEASTQENQEESLKDWGFNVGDRVVVNYKIVEGDKSRVQPYEGVVIGIKGGGISKTFTVRRIGAANIGVERIFPMQSPNIDSVTIKTRGKVRRSKLYYLRDRVGKAASKVKEA